MNQKTDRWMGISVVVLISVAGTLALSGCSMLENLPIPGLKKAEAPASSATGAQSNAQAIKALMNAGNAKAKTGQWASAAEDYLNVLKLDARHAPAHVQLGWVYAELKQWDDARSHLISAVALAPDNAGAHANLAWVYAEKQRWNDAQQEAKKAIDLDPNNSYSHATLAWAYQSTGQTDLAIAEYEKSLELNPALENSRLALGVSYCNKGLKARAQEQLAQLQKTSSPKASELITRLGKGCGTGK